MTTSPHRLRVLVAGAGGFGKEHLGRLAGRPDVKIAGVADANPARLAAVRAGFYPDDDPVLMTLIHDIDIAQWIADSDFHSIVARRSEGVGYRSLTAVSATTATGIICDLRTAWTFTGGDLPPDRVEAVGDRGGVELVIGSGLDVYAEGRRTRYSAADADDSLRNEQDHFLACVRDRSKAPALTLSQALVGLRLADAAIESLRSHP